MGTLWTETGCGWTEAVPVEYENEGELHRLIEGNPQLLPLSGSPRLTVLGSGVYLAGCYMDILAVESTGRPVIVEVKQESNHESRREVVAQLLEYAAVLKGIDIDSLEREPLHSFLTNSGYESVFEAVTETYPGFTPDAESFHATMQEHLDRGDFRLVLALDEAPPGLQRIVAYLDAITIDVVTLDLVTIRPYVIDGTRVILSERIVPDSEELALHPAPTESHASSVRTAGAKAFRHSISEVSGEAREGFDRLIAWAEGLAELPHVHLQSGMGIHYKTLLPHVTWRNAGLVAIYNSSQRPFIDLHWSVIESCAPDSVEEIRRAVGETGGSYIENPPSELLEVLAVAYREAGEMAPGTQPC